MVEEDYAINRLKAKNKRLHKVIKKLIVCARCYPDDEGIRCKNCIVKKFREG